MKDFPMFYSTEFLMFICSGCGMIIGFIHRNKFPELKYLYIYPLASFSQFIIANLTLISKIGITIEDSIINISLNLFTITEFIIIYIFFKKVLLSKLNKKILRFSAIVYFFTGLINWIIIENSFSPPTYSYIYQSIAILIPVCLYFIELFKKPIVPDLLNEPSFWVTTGMAFYFACTLPLFLMEDFVYNKAGYIYEMELFSINFICYGILFLLITKAYLCRKREAP